MKTSEQLFEMAMQEEKKGNYGEAERLKRAAFEASANGD